mmetsp:Transcript_663/g.1035  ORF Transcript_663/g.1035 Transcript_663/m.1035 type:complete len:146 (-) Transcript_663:495-932(-)
MFRGLYADVITGVLPLQTASSVVRRTDGCDIEVVMDDGSEADYSSILMSRLNSMSNSHSQDNVPLVLSGSGSTSSWKQGSSSVMAAAGRDINDGDDDDEGSHSLQGEGVEVDLLMDHHDYEHHRHYDPYCSAGGPRSGKMPRMQV